MSGSLYDASSESARVMRKRAGAWLKALREEAGLVQFDLTLALEHSQTSTVSQIERGVTRIPPVEWVRWAELLRQEPQEFAKKLLYYYDPHVYHAVFGGRHPHDVEGLAKGGRGAKRT